MSFKAGEADILTGVLPQDVKELKDAGFEILLSDYSLINNIMPDAGNADSPFADKRVREAVEYAIDKKAICQSIGRGLWEPAYQWATSSEERYNSSVKPRPYDVTKAKELLASAGYKDGFKTKIIAQNTTSKEYLQAIQAYLKAVGIDAALDLYDGGRLAAINKEGWKNGLMVYLSMNGGIVSMQRYFSATSTVFKSMLRSKDLLDKLNLAQSTPDEKKHSELMRDVIKYVADECVGIPIYADWNKFATTKKVKNSGWGVGWGSWWEPENVYLDK
jgi:peptide/nickel transport system substrate-binding protein